MGQPIRLDIGSGHVKHEGWLRVDQAVKRSKINLKGEVLAEALDLDPDIVCDIRAIPLPDDYADEARAIHVIEHFYPWEADAVMREWVRVLKPGAPLAVECPCLERIIKLADVPEVPPHFVHWGLYGDPRLQEPAMMHHWCYTKLQLMKLMGGAGLVDLRLEPAKFHQQIRDMRVVGFKPESRIQLA